MLLARRAKTYPQLYSTSTADSRQSGRRLYGINVHRCCLGTIQSAHSQGRLTIESGNRPCSITPSAGLSSTTSLCPSDPGSSISSPLTTSIKSDCQSATRYAPGQTSGAAQGCERDGRGNGRRHASSASNLKVCKIYSTTLSEASDCPAVRTSPFSASQNQCERVYAHALETAQGEGGESGVCAYTDPVDWGFVGPAKGRSRSSLG